MLSRSCVLGILQLKILFKTRLDLKLLSIWQMQPLYLSTSTSLCQVLTLTKELKKIFSERHWGYLCCISLSLTPCTDAKFWLRFIFMYLINNIYSGKQNYNIKLQIWIEMGRRQEWEGKTLNKNWKVHLIRYVSGGNHKQTSLTSCQLHMRDSDKFADCMLHN